MELFYFNNTSGISRLPGATPLTSDTSIIDNLHQISVPVLATTVDPSSRQFVAVGGAMTSIFTGSPEAIMIGAPMMDPLTGSLTIVSGVGLDSTTGTCIPLGGFVSDVSSPAKSVPILPDLTPMADSLTGDVVTIGSVAADDATFSIRPVHGSVQSCALEREATAHLNLATQIDDVADGLASLGRQHIAHLGELAAAVTKAESTSDQIASQSALNAEVEHFAEVWRETLASAQSGVDRHRAASQAAGQTLVSLQHSRRAYLRIQHRKSEETSESGAERPNIIAEPEKAVQLVNEETMTRQSHDRRFDRTLLDLQRTMQGVGNTLSNALQNVVLVRGLGEAFEEFDNADDDITAIKRRSEREAGRRADALPVKEVGVDVVRALSSGDGMDAAFEMEVIVALQRWLGFIDRTRAAGVDLVQTFEDEIRTNGDSAREVLLAKLNGSLLALVSEFRDGEANQEKELVTCAEELNWSRFRAKLNRETANELVAGRSSTQIASKSLDTSSIDDQVPSAVAAWLQKVASGDKNAPLGPEVVTQLVQVLADRGGDDARNALAEAGLGGHSSISTEPTVAPELEARFVAERQSMNKELAAEEAKETALLEEKAAAKTAASTDKVQKEFEQDVEKLRGSGAEAHEIKAVEVWWFLCIPPPPICYIQVQCKTYIHT